MRFDKKKLVKSPIVILTLIALTIGGGMAAYLTLWTRSPTLTMSAMGFDAMIVGTSSALIYDGGTELTALEKVDNNHYRFALIIKEFIELEEGQLTIDIVQDLALTNYSAVVSSIWLMYIDGVAGAPIQQLNMTDDPNCDGISNPNDGSLGSIYKVGNNGVVEDFTWIPQPGQEWRRYVLVEIEIQQIGEVTNPADVFNVKVDIAGDMYEST